MEQDKRCMNCILPSQYPTISFDESGVCNICNNWKNKWKGVDLKSKENILNDKLKNFQGKTKPYDCIVGLSGGKDSSYAAFILKEKGMSPLAVTFDNCFMTDVAYRNINATVSSLSLGHIRIMHSWDYMRTLYKHFLLTAGEFCSVCNVGIRVALYRIAKEYNINLIVSGRSERTEANSPDEFFTCSPGYFGKVSKNILSRKERYTFMYFNQITRAYWTLRKRPYYLELPAYMSWNEDEMLEIMKKEMNWEGKLGEQHSDCKMNSVKEYLKLKKFGVPELSAKISNLIRDNQISRDEGLASEDQFISFLRENERPLREQIMEVFDISEFELEESIRSSHLPYISGLDTMLSKAKSFLRV